MANQVVGIDVVARLDQLKAQLASIPDIGGKAAKDLTAQLSKEIKAAERAAKAAGDQSKKTRDDFTRMGDAAGAAGSGAKKLRGFLGQLSPELASVAGLVDDVGDALEVMSALGPAAEGALLALTAAAAPLAGQLVVLQRESAEASARLIFQAQHLHDNTEAMRGYEDATLKAAVATGQLSERAAELEAIQTRAIRGIEDFQASQEDARRAAETTIFTNEKWLSRLDVLPGALKTAIDYYGGFSSSIGEAEWRLAQLDAKERTNQETLAATAAAERVAAVAVREHAAAVQDADAAYQARLFNIKKEADSEREAILQRTAMEARAVREFMDAEEARTKTAEQATKDRIAIYEEEAAERARIESAQITAYSDMAGAIASIAQTAGENMTEGQKEAALAAFAVQKGAAMVQAGINTVLAVSEASTAAPYPANIPLMAAAGAVGLAQEVAIAAQPPPSFGDTPAPMQMQQSGTVRLAAGDVFAAAQDPAELRRQVGAEPSAGAGPSYVVIGPRAFGALIRDDVRLNTPLGRAVRGGTTARGTRRAS